MWSVRVASRADSKKKWWSVREPGFHLYLAPPPAVCTVLPAMGSHSPFRQQRVTFASGIHVLPPRAPQTLVSCGLFPFCPLYVGGSSVLLCSHPPFRELRVACRATQVQVTTRR
eukprot:gene25571-biopygen16508